MKGITRTMLRTIAGLAVAGGLVVGGAGVATAAPVSASAHTASPWPASCNPWAREQWNLNGSNTVKVPWNGRTLTYSVTFRQFGSCLTGTLTDPGFPATGPIYGTVRGNHVTFSFTYPAGSIQGTRTYTGSIHPVWFRHWFREGHHWAFTWLLRAGFVSGTWSETGSENGSGTFKLANTVHRACPWWFWPGAGCSVFPR